MHSLSRRYSNTLKISISNISIRQSFAIFRSSLTALVSRRSINTAPQLQQLSSSHTPDMNQSLLGEGAIEQSVGICTYANKCAGFQGILKQRYSDFVVREVTASGEVLALQNLSAQEIENKYFPTEKKEWPADGKEIVASEEADKVIAQFKGLLAEGASAASSSFEELQSFLVLLIDKSPDCPPFAVCPIPCTDKPTRTALHGIVRNHIGHLAESDTVHDADGTQRIRIFPKKGKGGNNSRGGNAGAAAGAGAGGGKGGAGGYAVVVPYRAKPWPAGLGDYLQFTLLKENVDTMSACNIIARHLKINVGRPKDGLQYAGTKDKRAVTLQQCTIYRRKPSDLARLNKFAYSPTIRVGDFSYVSEALSLGSLQGNRFTIALRAVNQPEAVIATACQALHDTGFINYFGLQRFGMGGSMSHVLGRAIFLSDWKLAVELLFAPREGDKAEVASAKKLFQEKRFRQAVSVLPFQMQAEKMVLEYLSNYPNDYSGAYNNIPRNTRLICAHAYQSAVWNKAVSERIQRYGLTCVEGDLVAINMDALTDVDDIEALAAEGATEAATASISGDGSSAAAVVVPGEAAVKQGGSYTAAEGNAFQQAAGCEKAGSIHVVTEEDIRNNAFTIHDVILPLPGALSIFPTNSIGSYISELLAQDGLTLPSFSSCAQQYRSKGAYRRILQKATDFEYKVIGYDDANAELVETELNLFSKPVENKKFVRRDKAAADEQKETEKETEMEMENQVEGAPAAIVDSSTDPCVDPSAPAATSATDVEAASASSVTSVSTDTKPRSCLTSSLPTVPLNAEGSTSDTASTKRGREEASASEGVRNHKFTGVVLRFTLPSGTYATMMLRELTKESTFAQYQAQLTAAAALTDNSSSSGDSSRKEIEGEEEGPNKKMKIDN